MTRYSVQARNSIFVKSYRFLFIAKKIGRNIGKNISKNLSSEYCSKRAIQKGKEATGDLVGNKIAD